jgi:hypothetical protein
MSIPNTCRFAWPSRTILAKKKCPLQNCGSPTCPSFVHYVLLTSCLLSRDIVDKDFYPCRHCLSTLPLLFVPLFETLCHVCTVSHTQDTSFRSGCWCFPVCYFLLHRCIFSNPFTVPGPMITSDCLTRPQDGVKLTTGGWLWILLWIILTTGHHDSSFQKDNLHVERPDSRDHLNYMWVRLTTCLD